MSHVKSARTTNGAPIDEPTQEVLRRLVAEGRIGELAETCALSRATLLRAAGGAPLLSGNRQVILIGLGRMREAGELDDQAAS